MKLSIVIATLNRESWLRRCINSIKPSCGGIEHEIIVVDGGSTDGTQRWLANQDEIFVIEQGARLGAVPAFNAGFWAAEGEYVAALNDDCEVVGQTLRLACDHLDSHPRCGQVAIPFRRNREPKVQHVCIGKQMLPVIYANFGVTRKWLGDMVGWWGGYLEHYAGDCELSFMIWAAGYNVDKLEGGLVQHHYVEDDTRRVCYQNIDFEQRWYYDLDVSALSRRLEREGLNFEVKPEK